MSIVLAAPSDEPREFTVIPKGDEWSVMSPAGDAMRGARSLETAASLATDLTGAPAYAVWFAWLGVA